MSNETSSRLAKLEKAGVILALVIGLGVAVVGMGGAAFAGAAPTTDAPAIR